MQYHPDVIYYFENPNYVGEWDVATTNVITVRRGSVELGEMLQLQLKIQADTIQAAVFKAYGNPYLIAGIAWIAEQLQGKLLADVNQLSHQDLIARFLIPKIKFHTAILIEEVLTAAINKAKQQEKLLCQTV